MNELNVTISAAIAALATSAFVFLMFVLGLDQVPIRGEIISLVTVGLVVFAVDAVLNIMSGVTRQTNRALNRLDLTGTVIRTLVIIGTLAFVLYMFYSVKDEFVQRVMATPNAWTLLYILTAFTLFDLVIIQGRKNRAERKFAGRGTSAEATANLEGHVIPPVGGYPENHEPKYKPSQSGLPEEVTEHRIGVVKTFWEQNEYGDWVPYAPTQREVRRMTPPLLIAHVEHRDEPTARRTDRAEETVDAAEPR